MQPGNCQHNAIGASVEAVCTWWPLTVDPGEAAFCCRCHWPRPCLQRPGGSPRMSHSATYFSSVPNIIKKIETLQLVGHSHLLLFLLGVKVLDRRRDTPAVVHQTAGSASVIDIPLLAHTGTTAQSSHSGRLRAPVDSHADDCGQHLSPIAVRSLGVLRNACSLWWLKRCAHPRLCDTQYSAVIDDIKINCNRASDDE